MISLTFLLAFWPKSLIVSTVVWGFAALCVSTAVWELRALRFRTTAAPIVRPRSTN